MVKNCGNCKWGAIDKNNLTVRVCKGLPPQVTFVQTPQGSQMQFHYPMVSAAECVCALHEPKLAIDSVIGNA
jgi:hypothetical protein